MTTPTFSELEALGKASRRLALVSAFAAVLVIGSLLYAGYQLSRLAAQRAQLVVSRDSVAAQLGMVSDSLTGARTRLSTMQCALSNSRAAINAFHENRYEDAIALYDEALKCDPHNAYLLNLRAYGLFKLKNYTDAIEWQRRSIAEDTTYAWGYFDLARFLCAASPSDLEEARSAVQRALSLRPDLGAIMSRDGEFVRLCGKGVLD